LDYTTEAADWHAHERARLSQVGQTPPYADGQIAAIAAVNHLVVTRNVTDFERFKIYNSKTGSPKKVTPDD
jgi:tRNA(fMet)-specific endonuclease VapC